jgi:guanylate kinase
MFKKNRIFVISAPSGTGKTTIAKKLKEKIPGLELVVSCTTRKPRPGEKNGINYHFITRKRFRTMIEKGRFAEWAEVYGNYYGTPKKEILAGLTRDRKILLTIDTQGGMNIKKKFPEATLIAVMPPSIKEQEIRIRKRRGLSEKEIQKRMAAAREEKKILIRYYHFRLINKNLENTIKKICSIINKGSKY